MAQKYFFCEKYNYLPQSGLISLFSKRHNYKAKSCIFVVDMTREELILDCRYFNGEEDPPEGINELMWGYEEAWVGMMLNDLPRLQKLIDYYTKQYDLPSILPYENDGTPIGIKAILWNRLDHWSYVSANADEFKEWYQEHYIANTKTHRQLQNNQ